MLKAADLETELIDTVCARVRERLPDQQAGPCEVVRPPVLPLGPARRTSPTGARSTSTAPRSRTGTWRSIAPGRGEGPRLQPGVRAARLAVAAHGRRDRHRRHAVHRRLGDDGARAAGVRDRPGDPPGDPGPARRGRSADRGARAGRARRTAPIAESILHVEVARETDRERAGRAARQRRRGCSARSARRSRTGGRCASARESLIDELDVRAAAGRRHRARRGEGSSSRGLADDHFTFLGYREYDLVRSRRRGGSEGGPRLRPRDPSRRARDARTRS